MKKVKAIIGISCLIILLVFGRRADAGVGSRPSLTKKAKIEIDKSDSTVQIGMFSKDNMLIMDINLFTNRDYSAIKKFPSILDGMLFYEVAIGNRYNYRCLEEGNVLAIAPVNAIVNRTPQLESLGFQKIDTVAPFLLFGNNPVDTVGIFSKKLKKGEKFEMPSWTIVAGFEVSRKPKTGELLYNGIRLPQEWPPNIDWGSDDPMPVPYLKNRPKLVYIDIGRQLFVDDFLVESTNMLREYHYPQKYEGNPLLRPETNLELKGVSNLAVAGPKSGGLWWNPEKRIFELWYEADWCSSIAYATSKDGLKWERPNLPLQEGTNKVLPSKYKVDSWTVVRDYRSTEPSQNFKMFVRRPGALDRARAFMSEDGISWGNSEKYGLCGDRSTMFFNPFRNKWVYSLRWFSSAGRTRTYWESDDFIEGMQWLPDEPVPWARADKLDMPDPRIGDRPQLYNLDAVAYESIMLGFYQILHGPSNDICGKLGTPKNTGLNFAYSRDGFHWDRPDRKMAINSEQKAVWDRGYVQSLGNICTVRGDKLWFYYIGFAGSEKLKTEKSGLKEVNSGMYANAATGVAFLRRDGFVSLNADKQTGLLTTRPLTFSGKYLFVNIDAPKGGLLAEVIDMYGKVIEPFSFKNCIPAKGDSTLTQIRWKGCDDLSVLNNRAMRFRFKLDNGKFYSFWVSRDKSGRSDGYVAGGGPGFTSDVDNVGRASIVAERKLGVKLNPRR
ncbi:MAG: hypothetical protein M0Q53_01710 [Prolixibacteraceae bacterium]|jgi:hypothetical protein|nr:hypothetical protein [Prolixibacteraceae bacterium]